MNDDRRLEHQVASVYAETAPVREPEGLLDDVLLTTSHARQRPEWLALIKEPPMRSNAHLTVGSPTVRVAAIVVATLLLALAVAGAGIAGSRLLAADGAIIVDPSGSGDFTTIAEAVADAADGDVILVRPGNYDESIVIDKGITIRGDGDRDDVIIELSQELPPTATDEHPDLPTAFLIEGVDAILENLTLQGESSRVVINGGAPELRGLVMDGVGRVYRLDAFEVAGLRFDAGTVATIENSVLTDTDVGIVNGSAPTLLGNELNVGAIFLAGLDGAAPVIRENTIAGSVKWGIAIWEGARPDVVGNTIVDAEVGITIEGPGTTPTLRGNTISGSRNQGISVMQGADPAIEDNVLTDNLFGINTSEADPTLVGNTVRGGSVGIYLTRGSPTLDANRIDGAGRGLLIGVGSTPILVENTVCGNETDLVVADGAGMPDTSGNEICQDGPEA